jgi:hypothetical protein
MRIGVHIWPPVRPGSSGGAPPPDYAALMSARLSGTTGFVFDEGDNSVLFQDIAGATPVTAAGQVVARVNSQYGSVAHSLVQATIPSLCPLRTSAASSQSDGVDDFLQQNGTTLNGVLNNKAAFLSGYRVKINKLDAALFGIGLGNTSRQLIDITAAGALAVSSRRVTVDANTLLTSAGGLISLGGTYTIIIATYYSTTGVVDVYLDGTIVATGTLPNAPANSEAADVNRWYVHRSNNNIGRFTQSSIGRGAFLPEAFTGADITLFKNYLEATTP